MPASRLIYMRGCAIFLFAAFAYSQAPNPAPPPPEAPETAEATAAKQPTRDDTHMFGVIPNYNSVNDPNHLFEAIGTREKFVIAAHDSFDPFSWLLTGIYAGVGQWQNQYPDYGQGGQGVAKRYGQSFADGAIANFMTDAVFPSLLHQDPRYFRRGEGRSMHRVGYALTRVLVTRSDSNRAQFNYSEIAGDVTAAALGNLYLPAANRTLSETMDKFAVNIVSDAGFNVLKEFWPDWRRRFLHR